ncbi:MAG: Type 1 glutamine amidotransferase-like domain-containing protein [Spirochaetales bacterium]|nr:Type 1 glutamine amidotransferase-like domain-containing protein [Spirochaetales bacterium]
MVKNIFLASSFADVSGYFQTTEQTLSPGQTVTFIPTASTVEPIDFFVDAAIDQFQEMGLNLDILDISKESKETIFHSIKSNEYIYISGGNTFYLLQELKKKEIDKVIIDQIQSGKVYIGESAGSMILSPNIEYVKDMDDSTLAEDLQSYDALDVIPFYPLPHYTNDPFIEINETILQKFSDAIPLFPFTNTQAIRVKNEKIHLFDETHPQGVHVDSTIKIHDEEIPNLSW